jgi:hypothetical protein
MMRKILLALAFLPALSGLAFGQALVQQTSQRLDAATVVGTSKTSAATITIPAVSGQFFYLTGVDISNCATTTVTPAAPTDISTTNLGGAVWTVGSGATAGLCQTQSVSNLGPAGLKSALSGTAVTVVLPTFATNQVIRVSVYGYYGN